MHFKLFSNCIAVKGYAQSIIYDLQLFRFEYIPNLLFEILQLSKEKSVEELKFSYNNEYDSGIDEYFNYLKAKEFGFYTSEPHLYPDLDLSWDSPFEITSCILNDNLKTISELSFSFEVDDITIILNSFNKEAVEYLKNIHQFILSKSMQLFIRYERNIAQKLELIGEIKRNPLIVIFNAPDDMEEIIAGFKIVYIKEGLNSSDACKVHPNYFSCNIPHFTEAQQFNTYFNKKLYIDINGELKNAPTSLMSHGNIKRLQAPQQLMKIINNPDFVQLHRVTKDMIEVCKDCEYRYMCVDDRIPIQDLNGSWRHKNECNYDPYTTKWVKENKPPSDTDK
jgi:SPASM domain peptide maturase of grasp-with-spasm system